jgi:hypothetical protein
MAARNSSIRKPFLEAARNMVPPHYGLRYPSGDQKESVMRFNRLNVTRLLSEALFAHAV